MITEKRKVYLENWRIKKKKTIREYRIKYVALNRDILNKKRREHNKVTHKERDYLREIRRINPILHRNYRRKWLQNNKELHQMEANKYRQNNPAKIMAQRVTKKMPLDPTCLLCPPNDSNTDGLLHHHPDYSIPDFYVTVCPPCHAYLLNGGD